MTSEEKERITRRSENEIEQKLKELNQFIHDDLNIAAGKRVSIIAGMIMAGLGVEGEEGVEPLASEDLKSSPNKKVNDGTIIRDRIEAFLAKRELPEDKVASVMTEMQATFVDAGLSEPIDGEGKKDVKTGKSKLKRIYEMVESTILPSFTASIRQYIDLTGKLFNVMTDWIDIPDGDRNDVVLTPRYVTEFMARLAEVNMDSYVWDYAVGSAGFLVSAMKLMLEDAATKISDDIAREKKIEDIKQYQLLGIEKRVDIYILAVLNMILMGDGSSHIIRADSLTEYDGTYGQGKKKEKEYPADVFLLNPPYSAPGKGFVFVKKAFGRMDHGKAAVLIQENAGAGRGLPYTKDILENNRLVASIHMSDIFCGKAGVQTAVYVFEVGKAHNEKNLVKFIDMTNDGYARQNRKKSSSNVNLRNVDHAVERYQEVVDIVLGRQKATNYYSETVIEDTISLNGDDWTYNQHRRINLEPTEEDFKKVVSDYLSWKVSAILRGEIDE